MATNLIDAADAPAKLRGARAILDESQDVFGERFGVSGRYIAALEAGATIPSLKMSVLLEELTGISPSEWIPSAAEVPQKEAVA